MRPVLFGFAAALFAGSIAFVGLDKLALAIALQGVGWLSVLVAIALPKIFRS